MPSRRSHTKSRKGCLHCKRRHVKCDEGTPKCSLCRKRKLECKYPPPSADPDGQYPSTPKDGPETMANPNGLPLPTRMVEMRLFHHYLTESYVTMCQGNLDANHFQSIVPRMAMAHPYLLDSLLAFSSLHLASLEADEKRQWLETALMYQNRACSALGQVLAEFSLESCGPAFVSSIFIMLCATAYPCISQDSHIVDPLAHILEIRQLIAGCSFLFQQLGQAENLGEMKGWLQYTDPDNPGAANEQEQKPDPELVRLRGEVLGSLDQLRGNIDRIEEPHRVAYLHTWEFLQAAVKQWPFGGPNGGILAFPLNIGEPYIELLKDGEWMARILFLHHGVSMHLISEKWFVRDWGRRLVAAILQSLEEEVPAEWASTLAWSRQAVGLDTK